MVIFHSYVKLPEGTANTSSFWSQRWHPEAAREKLEDALAEFLLLSILCDRKSHRLVLNVFTVHDQSLLSILMYIIIWYHNIYIYCNMMQYNIWYIYIYPYFSKFYIINPSQSLWKRTCCIAANSWPGGVQTASGGIRTPGRVGETAGTVAG